MNPLASVIDLTADSPDDGEPARPFRARNLHHHQRQQQQQQQQQQPQQRPPNQQRPPPPHRMHHPFSPDQLIELEIMNRGMSFFPALSASARRVQRIAGSLGFIGADVWRGGQQLDFLGSLGSPREPSPKPPMEEVPPTRDGFTRDTNAGPNDDDESVVVCPACNEELAYDPAGAAPAHGAAPTGRKRKRAAGEHHFWALKKCGHVYCADCFENRRPTKAAPNGAGFRNPSGKPPLGAPNDLRCVVDGCESKVATKTEWVGIFL
ncbi:hypothetical protein CDD83_5401 [Cordyceps sp. RAO-2017]|nr:hypothetical protein CDD83_5401 [Cordyceps sp. RAO-2017]